VADGSRATPPRFYLAGVSLDSLDLEELESILRARTAPLYQARFDAGQSDVLEQPLDSKDVPEGKLVADSFRIDGVTVHGGLPETVAQSVRALARDPLRRAAERCGEQPVSETPNPLTISSLARQRVESRLARDRSKRPDFSLGKSLSAL
jgi:hypothetical protein